MYRHTQTGTLVLAGLGLSTLLVLVLAARVAFYPITLSVAGLLLAAMVMFGSLTVEVDAEAVRLRFGPGPIRKRFPTRTIRAVRRVRNRWYWGWGIRWYFRGWLYNVSGLDAVELTMRDGRTYRIGTDEPEELVAAIQRARKVASS